MSFERPTKYVFHLNTENAKHFATLEQDEKHKLINEIIYKHFNKKPTLSENKKLKKFLKYLITGFVVIFIIIPLMLGIARIAFSSTKANYDYFTSGFVKYDQHQKNRR